MRNINLPEILASAILTSLLWTACTPNDKIDTSKDATTFNNHLAANISKPSTAVLSDATGGTVIGPNGSYIKIKPNCFIDAQGNDVTGNVTITYLDACKAGDMIYNKLLPISGTENLLSGGEYFVSATQNGNPLFLKPFMNTDAIFFGNNKTITNMQFFDGTAVANNPNTVVNWTNRIDSNTMVLVFNGDSIDISGDSLGYCNADRFISNPNYASNNFTINGATVSKGSFYAMCVYKDYNGYWPLYINDAGVVSGEHIPTNFPVHFVVFGIYNNQFYRGELKNITAVDGMNYTINLTEADPSTNKAWLNNL